MSSKENIQPSQAKKSVSKIPVPKLQPVSAAKKGQKRAISPSACTNDCKRSPSSSKRLFAKNYKETVPKNGGQRKTLGELPCKQRKIVKVRRMLSDEPSNNIKGTKRTARTKVANGKGNIGTACTGRKVFGIDQSCLPDQSGIVFEKDDFALQSILDETGIQYEQPKMGNQLAQSKCTRHTLAAVPQPKRESAAPSCMKRYVDDFRKVCDDFITHASSKQPNPKRQCVGASFRNDDSLNLKLTPSKTDFCSKFGVEKSVTFKGVTPGVTARQSLPWRTKVRPPDPFVVPARSSMVAQTPRRLAKVGEEVEPDPDTVGRHSLAAQTPLRVLKKVKEVDNGHSAVVGYGITGRPSIQPQTPGQVSLSAQTPGRQSLAPVFQDRFSLSAQTLGRQSLAVQTPGRMSLYEKNGNGVTVHNTSRMSLSTHLPGRVSLSAQKPSKQGHQTVLLQDQGRPSLAAQIPGRVSLSAQTPGRVSLSAQKPQLNPSQGRLSIIQQTPGRVKKPNQGLDRDPGTVNIQEDFQNICENLQGRFSMQTPGRVHMKEKIEERENDIKKAGPSENKDDLTIDMVQKECPRKTPTKDKAVPACATPVRVKVLQADEQTPKSTPQRVLKSVLTPQHTPRRVLVTGASTRTHTPKGNTNTPQEPQRLPVKMSTPVTPLRIMITPTMESVTGRRRARNIVQQETQLKSTPRQDVPYSEMPKQEVAVKKTLKEETPRKKTPSKSRLGEGVDLRTFWKTKKTPSKSPILKEVLTKESSTETSTPQSCNEMLPSAVVSNIKRKKTLTWADALESCQFPENRVSAAVKTEDEKWEPQEVKTQPSHDAMQDNPHQEKSTSSPTKDTHVTTLTDTQNSLDNMQLPVCLTGSGSAYSVSTSGSIDVENKPQGEDPCSKADDTLVSHPPTFAQLETDSLLVSQRELGQHHSNVLANTTQNEFLQKQIELFEEKKRQLTQLQMQIQQQLFKASDPGPVTSEHELDNVALAQSNTSGQIGNGNRHAGTSDENLMEQVKLDNHHFGKNLNVCNLDFSCTSNTSTQGIFVSGQVNLDLNSNVTGSENTYEGSLTEVRKEVQSSPILHGAETFSGTQEAHIFCTPTQQKFASHVEDDITPYILKAKSESEQSETVREKENSNKRGLEFEEPHLSVKSSVDIQTELISVPLWTPLAMKTVAKQLSVDKTNEENQSVQTVQSIGSSDSENTKSESKPKIEFVAKSEIDTSVTEKESAESKSVGLVPNEKTEFVEERETVATPPRKKSAFRSVGGTGLSPVVGSLSLRANTVASHESSRVLQSQSLHSSVLRVANERYLEALLDDEVALFMCRLSPGSTAGKGRDLCCDPVAKILLQGDEMHFIPVEVDFNQTRNVHVEGSAFTKYSIRAT